MAGLGRKVFASGEILTAADLQGYAVDQSIMVFDDSSARSAAISSPSEGMTTYREDADTIEFWNGSSWVEVGGEQGKVKQVVWAYDIGTATTTSTTFQDTGLTATIAPTAADSKVLVIVAMGNAGKSGGNDGIAFKLLQDGSEFISQFAGNVAFTDNSDRNRVGSVSHTQLYSPATTSAVVYKVQFAATNGSGTAEFNSGSLSTITLMEIGA